jgi:Mrp family chromosome partitioning ATPase
MSDQAFVKAFSRKRPASDQPSQSGGIELGNAGSVIQEPSGTPATPELGTRHSLRQQGSSPASGGLQLDQSVASTARVWVDDHADRVSRADYADDGIPRPHLETLTGDQSPSFEPRDRDTEMQGARPDVDPDDLTRTQRQAAAPDESDGFAQPIQDAYASTFTDAAIFVNDELSKVGPAEVLRGMREADAGCLASGFTLDQELSTRQPQPYEQSSESVTRAEVLQPEAETPELIIENPFATAAQRGPETGPGSPECGHASVSDSHVPQHDTHQPVGTDEFVSDSTPSDLEQVGPTMGLKPFQAVWEVDVLDVPTTVADLFFEGRLFQQIAERMSDAIDSGLNSVIVTSAQPGEGRSSVAVGLAMAAAAAGKRVALVDANLEQPKLADELRLELQYGWVDTIRAGLPIKEVAVHAVEDGVTLIPLMPPKGKNAATGYEVVQLVDLLKDKFELIILDGPTSQSGQIHQCASAVDSAIIVRDMTRTDTLAINDFSYRLREAGVQGVGVVENFT